MKGRVMNYISAKEAAANWGVSVRNVQRLLKEGRIYGAKRYGNYWMIPAGTAKPADPRRAREHMPERSFYTQTRQCISPLMTNLYSTPGTLDALVESFCDDSAACDMARSGIALIRGDIAGARSLIEQMPFDEERPDICVAIAFMRCICALYDGSTQEWLLYRNKLRDLRCITERDTAQRDFWLGSVDIALYATDGFPSWFCEGDFSFLPKDSYPIARYTYLKYLLLSNKSAQAVLYARPLVCECCADGALYAELYCRLIIASCLLECGEVSAASKEIDRAIQLALPDRLYAPLGEYRALLGVLLDERLLAVDKEAANAIKLLDEAVASGWTILNKELYGLINTLSLTPQERRAAQLAAKGLSNVEISERMKLSIHTVKRYISESISKTEAKNRTELAKYIGMEPFNR